MSEIFRSIAAIANLTRPSSFVLSPQGKQAGHKMWKETVEIFKLEATPVETMHKLDQQQCSALC